MHKPRPKATSVSDALAALMDFPHPLEILGEPNSYGPDGAISRYHNPDNYTRALGGIVSARTRDWRASFAASTTSADAATADAGATVSADALPDASEDDSVSSGCSMENNGENERPGSMDVTSSLDIQMVDDGLSGDAMASLYANGLGAQSPDDREEGGMQRRAFLPSMQWVPWFKRLAEEEGTATIRVGSRSAGSSSSSDEAFVQGPPQSQNRGQNKKRAKLPELHRIQMPRS